MVTSISERHTSSKFRAYVMSLRLPHTSVCGPEHSSVDLPVIHDVNGQRFLGAFAKLQKRLLASLCLSICPHGTTWLPAGWIFMKIDI
jgi:hypothetical protein